MPDPFVHLHVASGHSLQYGASHPHVLVERAFEQEMDTLALTDRDGTYGAVKFALACQQAGIRPVLGVDLAYGSRYTASSLGGTRPPGDVGGRVAREARAGVSRPRTPAKGGAFRDDRLPRVTVLAAGRAGWAALCRLVSATHLAGERGRPVTTPGLISEHAAQAAAGGGALVVLLGPGSTLGAAATARRDDHAREVLARWREVVPSGDLLVEVVSHRLPAAGGQWGPGSSPHAARMAGVAREAGLGVVLSNAVRYADRLDAPVVDVLDAARQLVPLGSAGHREIGPHAFRANAEGYLKSGKEMHVVAEEVARLAGWGERGARDLLAHTRVVADRCTLDPGGDLGLGEVHFPEFGVVSTGSTTEGRGSTTGSDADALLRIRCEQSVGWRYGNGPRQRIWKRLDDELELIRDLGYASYFLTVAEVTDLIRDLGVRCAARGSGAGSLVNYLLGISGVDPIRHNLLMERFLSPLRRALPDIDVDVESARRLEVYERILDRFGGERCVCVSMMDTYRVRHAVRDVGAALGLPPGEIDAIAKAFPHIRARDARTALRELPELRASGLGEERLDLLFRLAERLDGLPRHIAVHPCGVLLSDATLLDRTPVEASYAGFPMSQFDKDDVEELGLLKLDVLGVRMQSAMAHAVAEIERVDGVEIDLDDEAQVPFDDEPTYAMISEARTLGVFQIESPGQRELVGKSGIEDFGEIITDISLFRPGPVKSDMVTPYLEAKQGWRSPRWLHPDLKPILEDTHGVVVFHEQVIEIIAQLAGVSYAQADERRRALGDPEGMAETERWFFPRALAQGYELPLVQEVWKVLASFASFGFCKAHAAAFALPTFQSAWLKAHHPAHFLAGVLTHDPGMYPKRLILDDARQFGVAVLPLDVNASEKTYVVERVGDGGGASGDTTASAPSSLQGGQSHPPPSAPPPSPAAGSTAYGIRLALSEVKGISEAEVERIVAARPYVSLSDFWHRARVSRPVAERLVLAGAFDGVYGLGACGMGAHGVDGADGVDGVRRRDQVTRRDLLLQVSELDRFGRAVDRAARGRGLASKRSRGLDRLDHRTETATRAGEAAARSSSDPATRDEAPRPERHALAEQGVWARASAQSRAARTPAPVSSVQLALDLGDAPLETERSGLPEMDAEERLRAELEILGLDASRHVVEGYAEFLDELGTTRSRDLLDRRSKAALLVGGVKVATQTPPVRSGRRVIFLTLDDATGPVDCTFFEDAQGPYAATVFHSWLLVVRGELRRTGRRGVSLRATGAWPLPDLYAVWRRDGVAAVRELMAVVPEGFAGPAGAAEDAVAGAAESRSTRPVMSRVLVHSSGFRMSPYADVRPAGEPGGSTAGLGRSLVPRSAPSPDEDVARRLWHRSPGSAG